MDTPLVGKLDRIGWRGSLKTGRIVVPPLNSLPIPTHRWNNLS